MNRLLKEAVRIEKHAYAPELNGLRLKNGLLIKARHINTFDDIRALYKPPNKIIKRVKVSVKHTNKEHLFCDKVYCFGAKSYKQLKQDIALIKERHNLLDAKVKIESINMVNI